MDQTWRRVEGKSRYGMSSVYIQVQYAHLNACLYFHASEGLSTIVYILYSTFYGMFQVSMLNVLFPTWVKCFSQVHLWM